MKEMIQARKEQLQERGVSGFTLMEMLIVVAIIAVLVAIAIPVFTSQLDNAKYSADEANGRALYAALVADSMTADGNAITAPTATGTASNNLKIVYPSTNGTTYQFSDRCASVQVTQDGTSHAIQVVVNDGDGHTFTYGG